MGSSRVQIYLLGHFEVIRDQLTLNVTDWSRRKAATLLQLLALNRRLIKDQLIEMLWPDVLPRSGVNNLYQTLHVLRRILDESLGLGTADEVVVFEAGILHLGEAAWVDVHEFELRCSAAQLSIHDAQQALSLYRGDLLADDLYNDAIQSRREDLQRLHRKTVLRLADQYREVGDYHAAIVILTPLLNRDRTDETTHRELMRLYALMGQRHEALRQYQNCVEALAADLDVTPDPATEALYRQILNGTISAPSVLPIGIPSTPVSLDMETSLPLVGRQAELTTLRDWIRNSHNAGVHTILLAGDAGLGKTRLAFETLRDSARSGMTTLFGGAYKQEGPLSYHPFIEAFDRYLAEHQYPPEQNPITHFKPLGSTDPQQEHSALFRETAAFLIKLAKHNPVVLLVDDLHAADETSLRLFHYLARQTQAVPIILLATYQPGRVEALDTPCGALLNALYREQLSERLILSPLGDEDVDQMVTHLLGGKVSTALISMINELAEGNPFFVQEITRALLKLDQIEDSTGQWRQKPIATLSLPAGLRGLIRERVAHLGPSVEPVLRIGTVIGRQFSLGILRQVARLPDDHLLDALDAALAGRVLDETADGYRFRHSLIRQGLYEGLSEARRAHLHLLTAQAIESACANQARQIDMQVEALAYHYDSSEHRERAIPYLVQAGQKAAHVYAFEVAVRYFERALKLIEQMGLNDQALHWQILLQLGRWHVILADSPRAVASFDRALTLTITENWRPNRVEQVRVHRAAARTLITAGDMLAAERHLHLALDEVDSTIQDSPDHVHLLYDLSLWHWHRNDYLESFDIAQRSLTIAERLNDEGAIGCAFEMLALAAHSLGDWQQGLAFEARRPSITGPGLDVTEAFDVHLCLWEYHLYGDTPYETVKHTVNTTLQQARRMGARRAIALSLCFAGALDFQAGHWPQAEAVLQESVQLYRQIGAAAGEALACQRLGQLYTASGEFDPAMKILEEGVVAAERGLLRAHCLTRLYATMTHNRLLTGDTVAADHVLALGLTTSQQHGHCSTCDSLLLPAAVSVRIAQGNLPDAEVLYRQLEEAAARYRSNTWMAMARQTRGGLAAA